MKKPLLAITLIVATALMGCGDKKSGKETTVRGGTTRGGGAAQAAVPANPAQANSGWGLLMVSAGSLNEGGQQKYRSSNSVSRVFLNTNVPWNVIGATTTDQDDTFDNSIYQQQNCISGRNCIAGVSVGNDDGVSAHIPLTLQSGTYNTAKASGQRVALADGGRIILGFWDSLTGTTSPVSGNIINPIAAEIPLNAAASYIQGSTIHLEFADQAGAVAMDGVVNGSTWNATIKFMNTIDHNDSPVNNSGTLGTVQLNVGNVIK